MQFTHTFFGQKYNIGLMVLLSLSIKIWQVFFTMRVI